MVQIPHNAVKKWCSVLLCTGNYLVSPGIEPNDQKWPKLAKNRAFGHFMKFEGFLFNSLFDDE